MGGFLARLRGLAGRTGAADWEHAEAGSLPPVLRVWAAGGPTCDQYRIIRTKIAHDARQFKAIAVSSPGIGDGKTINAINIAAAFGMKPGARALLIDGDLRRPSLAPMLGLPGAPGLAEVLTGSCDAGAAMLSVPGVSGLKVLPAGATTRNSAELLDTDAWRELCRRLRDQFDTIVIDSPPAGVVAEYDIIEAAVDGVILIVRVDWTKRKSYGKAVQAVRPEKLAGVVLNHIPRSRLFGGFGRAHSYYEEMSLANPPEKPAS